MKIYIGADHNGHEFKQKLSDQLRLAGHDVVDEGGITVDPDDDFPYFASKVAHDVLGDPDKDAKGILVCGSGQGVCMAANRFKGIRAALCWNLNEARSARNDDDSNVLCLSSKYSSFEDATAILNTWLATPFAAAPRYIRRLKQLDELG